MQEGNNEATLSVARPGAAEGLVITQSQAEVIRQMHGEGVAKRQIARGLELDVKTVRKALRGEWKAQTRMRASKLDPFAELVRQRGPEVNWNAMVLLRELRAEGYDGSYPPLARLVRPLRPAGAVIEPVIRFETPPGKQSQVDWGMLRVWIGEAQVKVHIFVMILGYSRRTFARAYEHERIGNLLDGFEQAFEHFGGRTETVLLDNPRTVVTRKDEATGTVEWNGTFRDRMEFYGVEAKLCRYYRAQTKGKVESGVKYVKRNALAGRRFASLEALNAWLLEWALTVADERVHGTTHEIPRERFEREERAALIPITRRPPAVSERRETRRVDSDGTVVVDTNRYPVPYTWIGATVMIERRETEILFEHDGTTLRYARIDGRYRTAPWAGAPRALPCAVRAADAPPRLDRHYLEAIGQVDVRPLEQYVLEVNA